MTSNPLILWIRWRHRLEKSAYAAGVRRLDALRLPEFLGIGAEKAGTSWLHANLAAHPDLHLPPTKELHYFCCEFTQPLRCYARHFQNLEQGVAGEITPHYADLNPRRIRYLRRILPDLKLIFLMRHPVDRAWSHAYMNLVSETGRRLDEVPEHEFRAHFQSERALQRGDYRTLLEKWQHVFPPEQFYVGLYDWIVERPATMLAEIFEFLRVGSDLDWDRLPVHERVQPRVRDSRPAAGAVVQPAAAAPESLRAVLHELYRERVEALVNWFGPQIEHWRIK